MGRVSSRSHANPERSSGQCGAMLPPPPYLTGPLCRQPLGAGSGPSSPPAPLLRHQTLGGGKGPTGGASSPAGPAAPPGPRPGGGEPSQAQPPAPLRTREIPRQLPAGDKSTGGERGGRDGSRSTSAASTSHEPAPPPRPPPGRRSLPGATTKQGQTVCLSPSAPWVKLIVTRILNSSRREIKAPAENGAAETAPAAPRPPAPAMSPHLLLVLLLAAALCRGAPLAGELRCRCVRTVSEVIPPRRLARVEFVAEGPHCAEPEVIATTKQGQTVCLSPSAPWVKLIVTRILNSSHNQL
ncbi:collagen alpha-1(I) chain-like isoform X4 [Aquila chrysaetos chrysaetos]|uniref:collagen alpha-1(I) chain-like isoform X4 n=1 Tax=Aquila chrysaetos chrysaetos TaxID=223781 RepID=UPI0011771AA8|nr:collagen alpha-1(I) chain-like isoform X4 [Aquila chrysaetos chrysaetos]